MSLRAVLVEDDPDGAHEIGDSLRSLGFEVEHFENVADCDAWVQGNADEIELFVLDRNLPASAGDDPADDAGDQLFLQVSERFPDSFIVVFTGFSSTPHMQTTPAGRGQLRAGLEESLVDRVRVLEKFQFAEFLAAVEAIAVYVRHLDDLQLQPDPRDLTGIQQRLLRKTASRFGGTTVEWVLLTGGRSGNAVFSCRVMGTRGELRAAFIAKETSGTSAMNNSFTLSLPRSNVVPAVGRVDGLCDGRALDLYQPVVPPEPLDRMVLAQPTQAARLVENAGAVLLATRSATGIDLDLQSVAEYVAPLTEINSRLVGLVGELRGSIVVGTHSQPLHGDLHGGNILAAGEVPVFIDAGYDEFGPSLLDPLTLTLSTWLHPDGAFFGVSPTGVPEPVEVIGWISNDQDISAIVRDPVVVSLIRWCRMSASTQREVDVIATAYAARQLRYDEATADAITLGRIQAILVDSGGRLQ